MDDIQKLLWEAADLMIRRKLGKRPGILSITHKMRSLPSVPSATEQLAPSRGMLQPVFSAQRNLKGTRSPQGQRSGESMSVGTEAGAPKITTYLKRHTAHAAR